MIFVPGNIVAQTLASNGNGNGNGNTNRNPRQPNLSMNMKRNERPPPVHQVLKPNLTPFPVQQIPQNPSMNSINVQRFVPSAPKFTNPLVGNEISSNSNNPISNGLTVEKFAPVLKPFEFKESKGLSPINNTQNDPREEAKTQVQENNPPRLLQDLMRFQKEAFDKAISVYPSTENLSCSSKGSASIEKAPISPRSQNSSQMNSNPNDPRNIPKSPLKASLNRDPSPPVSSSISNEDPSPPKQETGIVNFLINIAKKSQSNSSEPLDINSQLLDPEQKAKIVDTLDKLKAAQKDKAVEKAKESSLSIVEDNSQKNNQKEKSKEERLNEKLKSLGILKNDNEGGKMKDLVNKFFKSKDPRLANNS